MNIRPIKNEADYQAALKEIERLFDATPGTPTTGRRGKMLLGWKPT